MRRQGEEVPHSGADGESPACSPAGGMDTGLTTFLSLSQEVLLSPQVSVPRAVLTVSRPASVVTRHGSPLDSLETAISSTCATGGSRQKQTSSDT